MRKDQAITTDTENRIIGFKRREKPVPFSFSEVNLPYKWKRNNDLRQCNQMRYRRLKSRGREASTQKAA